MKMKHRIKLLLSACGCRVFMILVPLIIIPLAINLPRGARLKTWSHGRHSVADSDSKGWGDKPLPAAKTPLDATWQPVAGTRYKFFVYSAYVEHRTVAAVRVIAATKTRGADPVFCRLWLPGNRTLTLKAKVQPIREHWFLKYSASFVLCMLRSAGVKPWETAGAVVAVIAREAPDLPPTNLLTVLSTEPKSGITDKLHACVKPFHYTYERTDWMVEWFELNRLLGVTHFYMYNDSLSDSTACLLDHYQRRGLVTLLPWRLPFISQVEIRTESLLASFNDCLYRAMSSAGWLLVIDADELVLPRKKSTLLELLKALSSTYKPSRVPSGFLFRNAFFYVPWEDDPEAPVPLLTARKTRRWTIPHPYRSRSKYIVRPGQAVQLGNHFLLVLAPYAASSVGVSANYALLHHYRETCEYDGLKCLTVPSTVDRTAHKWSSELMQRVNTEKELLSKDCPTPLDYTTKT